MIHVVPLALGAVAGAALVRLLKNREPRAAVAEAASGLRQATASGLRTVERASARLAAQVEPAPAADAAEAAPARPAKRARKPRKSA